MKKRIRGTFFEEKSKKACFVLAMRAIGYILSIVFQTSPSSRGLGHRVFIPATGVRIPVGMPFRWYEKRRSKSGVFFVFVLNLSKRRGGE